MFAFVFQFNTCTNAFPPLHPACRGTTEDFGRQKGTSQLQSTQLILPCTTHTLFSIVALPDPPPHTYFPGYICSADLHSSVFDLQHNGLPVVPPDVSIAPCQTPPSHDFSSQHIPHPNRMNASLALRTNPTPAIPPSSLPITGGARSRAVQRN